MDVDQDLREYQRQYLDFLDDGVSTAKTKPSQKFIILHCSCVHAGCYFIIALLLGLLQYNP